MITVCLNKSMTDIAKGAVINYIKQFRAFIKLKINEGDVVFNQNSLSYELCLYEKIN